MENLDRALKKAHADPRCIVIRLGQMPFMDITGMKALAEAARAFERQSVRLLLCEARPNVLRKLVRAGLVRKLSGPRRYVRDLEAALRSSGEPRATTGPDIADIPAIEVELQHSSANRP